MKLSDPVKYMPDQREFVNKLSKLEGLGGNKEGYLGTIGNKEGYLGTIGNKVGALGGEFRRENNN